MEEIDVYLLLGLMMIIMIVLSTGLQIIREGEQAIVEKLGAYDRVLNVGLHFILPFVERVAVKIDNTEKVTSIKDAKLITKDDKELKLEYKGYYLVTDVKLFHYGVKDIDNIISKIFLDSLKKEVLKINYEDLGTELIEIETNIKEALEDSISSGGIKFSRIVIEKKI